MKALKIIALLTAIRDEDLNPEDERDEEKAEAMRTAIDLVELASRCPECRTVRHFEP